jgi:hypothetical protein
MPSIGKAASENSRPVIKLSLLFIGDNVVESNSLDNRKRLNKAIEDTMENTIVQHPMMV